MALRRDELRESDYSCSWRRLESREVVPPKNCLRVCCPLVLCGFHYRLRRGYPFPLLKRQCVRNTAGPRRKGGCKRQDPAGQGRMQNAECRISGFLGKLWGSVE